MEKTGTVVPIDVSYWVHIRTGTVMIVIPIETFVSNEVVSIKLPPEVIAGIKRSIKETFRSVENDTYTMH